jgi:hypothetical protein
MVRKLPHRFIQCELAQAKQMAYAEA